MNSVDERRIFDFLDKLESSFRGEEKTLSGDPGTHGWQIKDAGLKLWTAQFVKSHLKKQKNLKEKIVFNFLNELIERFKQQKEPVGLGLKAGNRWREKMEDYQTISWTLKYIKKALEKFFY